MKISKPALNQELNSKLITAVGNPPEKTRDENELAEMVAGLLDQGADVNTEISGDSTALMFAAQNGYTKTVSVLLARGANVNAVKKPTVGTALIFATQNGHAEIVTELLAQGADIEARTSTGVTALIFAALGGHTEIVDRLLAQGADVNAKNDDGVTALMIADKIGDAEIVAKLLAQVADIKAKTSNDSKALIIAALNGRTEIVSNLLLRQDINVNAALDGATALMLAAGNGHTEIVSTLLSQGGIDVDAKTSDGSTALTIAARGGQAEAVSALLSRNDVDWKKVRDQLSHPTLLSDNEALFLLAATIPNEELRNSIIESFNEKNPDNKINQEGNDILGAGPEMYKKIKDLKSWHKRYLTSTLSSLDENAAESLANLIFFDLFNNHEKRQEALTRDNLVTGLVSKLGLSDTDFAEFTKSQEYLDAVSRLKPEDLHKLTTEIIDNSKAANGGEPTPQVLGLVAELRKGQINTPASSIETRRTKPGEPIKATKNQIPSFSI